MIAIDEYSREYALFRKLAPFLAETVGGRIVWMAAPEFKRLVEARYNVPSRLTFDRFCRRYLKCGERVA